MFGGVASQVTGGSFSDGAYTAVVVHLFNDEIRFNGKEVQWVDDDGNVTDRWAATSGNKGTTASDQDIPNRGPIPEGKYSVNPEDSNYDRWWKLGWGDNGSWGDVRTLIKPYPTTNTYNRNEMYFHGGSTPGSAGCIDLTNQNNNFHNRLQRYGKPLDVQVNY
jgi:lipoprotein-anchoring transpeptidase ErfK/SrfK